MEGHDDQCFKHPGRNGFVGSRSSADSGFAGHGSGCHPSERGGCGVSGFWGLLGGWLRLRQFVVLLQSRVSRRRVSRLLASPQHRALKKEACVDHLLLAGRDSE